MHIRLGMDQRGDPAQKPAMKCCQNQHRGEVTAAAVEFSGSLDRPLHRGRQFESNPQPPWCCFEGRCGLQFHIGSVRGSSCRGFLSFGFFWQVTWFALQDMDIWYVCMYIYNIIIYYICIIVYVCVYVVYVYIYGWKTPCRISKKPILERFGPTVFGDQLQGWDWQGCLNRLGTRKSWLYMVQQLRCGSEQGVLDPG